ncbi:MAG: 50S ribosomal protein L33 [Rhodobacteraceae bacterium]|nr:50S ribosomal protein L33 [Paracoccaceae bacterium]
MAKPTTIKIRLNSTAGTGHFYVTKKNARTILLDGAGQRLPI